MDDDQTPSARPSSLRHDADAKLPAAAFLRYEARADGWSAGRQAAFLSHLADHGVVEDAARCVGKHVSGGYALRREARGYAFNLGWEAALIIARRVVADNLMAAAVKGEQSRWVREDGVTTYTRQNTKLSLALLDRVNPATSLAEVLAVATRFDWFVQLLGDGVAAESLWDLFFEDALAHDEVEARARVRAALLLTDDLAGFGDDGLPGAGNDDSRDDAGPIEYKSMEGPPCPHPNQIFTASTLLSADVRCQKIRQAGQPFDGAVDDGNRRRPCAARTHRVVPRRKCIARRLQAASGSSAAIGRNRSGPR